MPLKTMRFMALLFTALALAPALAHLLELPNKIGLPKDDYLTVQQIYRGWALLGFVVAGALLSNLVLAVSVRNKPRAFVLTLIAFFCIVATQVVFWTITYPANADRQLDDTACQLAGPSQPMGVFACGERSAQPNRPHLTHSLRACPR